MSTDKADFTMKPIKHFTDLNQVECSYKTHLSCRGVLPSRSAVILMTKGKDNDTGSTSQEENMKRKK